MKKYHNIAKIRFEKHYLLLKVDGRDYRIDLRPHSKKLASADERTKMNFELSPSGYGIHWPELDEDLSIDGMIKSVKVKKTG
jgi:hypothetical protein